MPRRKTRKVSKTSKTKSRTKKRTKSRKPTNARKRKSKGTTGKVVMSGAAGLLRGATKFVAAVTPSKETVNAIMGAAWNSRSVRRIAGVIGGIVVLAVLSWIMLANLRTDERYTVDPGRIELAEAPSWADDELGRQLKMEIEDELRADLSDLPTGSAFDTELMSQIDTRISANPWVRRVVRIERRFPTDSEGYSRLLPTLEIRKPALAIVTDERYVLVDGESVVLPLHMGLEDGTFDAFNSKLVSPLRIVRGVDGGPPVAGEVWDSEQVSAAISMERVIRRAELDEYPGIVAMELVGIPGEADPRGRVHYQSDGGVVLIPDPNRMPGTRLLWGRPPVHSSTLELSPNAKLDQLRSKLREMDSVADARIDLRHRS